MAVVVADLCVNTAKNLNFPFLATDNNPDNKYLFVKIMKNILYFEYYFLFLFKCLKCQYFCCVFLSAEKIDHIG